MLNKILLTLTALAYYAHADLCQTSVYNGLSCLTSNAAASSYCLDIADGLAYLNPTTAQSVSTTTQHSTTTTTDESRSAVTITSIAVTSLTTTISTGALSTIYDASTTLTTIHDTITTYVSSPTATPSTTSTSTTCDVSAANAKLSSLDADEASTACSCIGLLPSTSSAKSAADVTVTETVTETAVPTTTIVESGQIWFTVFAATTISETITSATTQTKTVSLAAPTFTQTWGPKDGCLDLGVSATASLNATATENDAVAYCQSECSKQSECDFVWVQNIFPHYGGVTSFWECYFNAHPLNETSDVECGQSTRIWGTAIGYSALNRGHES
ncbi:hypothetical protein MBLNU459_g3143t1 [Dothideomycetes sp. NU459]